MQMNIAIYIVMLIWVRVNFLTVSFKAHKDANFHPVQSIVMAARCDFYSFPLHIQYLTPTSHHVFYQCLAVTADSNLNDKFSALHGIYKLLCLHCAPEVPVSLLLLEFTGCPGRMGRDKSPRHHACGESSAVPTAGAHQYLIYIL